jgi:hypothetical protein
MSYNNIQRVKYVMSSGFCGGYSLTDGCLLGFYTVWCAWFVITFWGLAASIFMGTLVGSDGCSSK